MIRVFRTLLMSSVLVSAGLAAGHPAWAQGIPEGGAPSDGNTDTLDTITVTATKSGENVYDALSGSSVIGRDQVQTQVQPGSVSDVLRLVPGVTTQTDASDPGTGVNVRGLQDYGRVNVLVDGARQNFQREGHGANGTFYFDPEMMKSVDVTRGPVSTVYGSGAIGGVVSFTTIDAGDVLRDGTHFGGRVKGVWETNGPAPLIHGEVAARPSDMFDIVGAATLRRAGDFTDGNGNTVAYTAQDLTSGLVKTRIRPADDHEITLSALRIGNEFDGGLSTIYGTRAVADTFTAGYRYTPPDSSFWDLSAKTYYTTTDVRQRALTGRDAGGFKDFSIGTFGVDLFNTSRFDTGTLSHQLTYGGDFFQDNVETFDSYGTSAQLTPSGERFVAGAFIQNKVNYASWLEVIGALRYDSYELTGDNTETKGTRLSPKITVGVTPWEPITFYATYAEGYRAPALVETLIDGFHPPPISTGRFFPNPNLKPEIAHNVEGGVNLRFNDLLQDGDQLRLKVGTYRNRVDDYIEQVFTLFPLPGGYQYQNIAQAVLRGVEVEGTYDAGTFFVGLAGSTVDGKNTRTREGLKSVPPNRISGTIGFRALDGKLELGTRITAVGEKRDAEEFGFEGDAYALVDVFASYKVNDDVTAGLVVQNLFDRQYVQYLNIYPNPGMTAKASLSIRY
ncbi:TonB-dependent hemoglobin/transferrin/lactoferrin family receptor [Microvirga pudoricolor]|uniref:TonB-dependent hemoglobin/transferrin/lactoferrin family receptor n=1 Tax=Microvirga pudoricolor TaxID=2778729 RepID=UPI00194E95AC|nr:TonB-dependent hemoglobin/transferrin/lactoferrin family receptor [Microvirga pudoricolor]MBM6592617.1 TonB-dependent hemoglobin/transferrin/lactoferrin family receptor [Microvirga pudoricolor]